MHDLSLSVKIAREALKNLHQYPEHPGGRKGFSGQAWVDSRVVQSFPSRGSMDDSRIAIQSTVLLAPIFLQ